LIEFAAVSKSFGDVEALAPLDLRIGDGEWLGIFGRNGSGKTSLLRILVGLAPPSSGELRIDGVVPDERAWKSFRRRLGYMPERIVFHENLSGRRTIEYYARLRGLDPGQALDVLDRVGLAGAAGRKVGSYSKGMRQRLCFAQALLGDPEILILDEPLDGLDPHGVHQFFALLRGIENRTVVFTSHQLPRFASAVA
jgi:Cu-processing system ATP-binding protein